MTAPSQSDYKAIASEVFLRSWLLPITTATAIGSKRWAAGMVLPYRTVRRITGNRSSDADYPVLWVDTLGLTYSDAARESDRTDARFQMLVDYPGHSTVLPDGTVAHCDWAEIIAAAHEEPYTAETVATRFVSEYRLCLSFVWA